MNLRIYYTTHTEDANPEVKTRQQRLFDCLDRLHLTYHKLDVQEEGLHFLQSASPLGIQLPQIFDHDKFLGGFDDFEGAVRAGRLSDFFFSNIQGKS